MCKKAVPYTSLSDIAGIRRKYDNDVLRQFKKKKKDFVAYEELEEEYEDEFIGTVEDKEYTWEEYLNANVLFTFLTSIDNAKIESNMLKSLLDIRGKKGLPTIVTTESSINAYTVNYDLKKIIWDDILSPNYEMSTYDRMYHVSTYKKYNIEEKVVKGRDY